MHDSDTYMTRISSVKVPTSLPKQFPHVENVKQNKEHN